jgi:hypothetical protein
MQRKDWLLAIFLILNYIDFFTTAYALNTGRFQELNPYYYLNPLLMDIAKIILLPVSLILLHRWMKAEGYCIIVAIYVWVVANNLWLLIL